MVPRGIVDDELESEGDDHVRLSRHMLAQSLEDPIKVRGTPQLEPKHRGHVILTVFF